MKYLTFAIPYSDDIRMKYVKGFLEENKYIFVQDTDEADFVVLPVVTKPYMFGNLEGKTVFHGLAAENFGYNYMMNDNFVYKNAVLTAEGAVTLLEQETPFSLIDASVLILGYGRIGKALHKILKSYSANVTVCSRSSRSASEAVMNGTRHIDFEQLKAKSDYRIVINTVPHIVLTKAELVALPSDAIILDLASFPGGVDTLVANSLHLKLLSGRAMPSKYTPETAGIYIGEAIKEMIEEGA